MKISRFLCIFLTFVTLTSCAAETRKDSQEPDSSESAIQSADSSAETDIYTELGEHDFNGRVFTFLYSKDQLGKQWIYDAEEYNGDIFNDTVYDRDLKISEMYNVGIDWYSTGGKGDEVYNALRQTVLAGDKTYDLAIGHMFGGLTSFISQGCAYNFNDLEYVDYDKSWWAEGLRDVLEVNGILLLQNSDIVYKFNDCIYFNKDMLTDFGYPSSYIYDFVDSGVWTWDKLTELARAALSDLDGNGIYDENDRYGHLLNANAYVSCNWVYASGMTIAKITDDGEISLENVTSARMTKAVETLNELINVGEQTYMYTDTKVMDTLEGCGLFVNGRSLFLEQITTILPLMRDVEINYGIVPLPKLDEEQDGYHAMATPQMMVLPATTDDPVFTGVILEALSMESYKTVNPAIYEVSASEKFLRDNKSYEMYQIIQSYGVYDFNWNFGSGGAFSQLMWKVVRDNKLDTLSSYIAANMQPVQETLDKACEYINAYAEK